MKQILKQLIAHQSLSYSEAKDSLLCLAQGSFNETETTAFISCYLMRPITVEELQGFRDALLELCIPFDTKGLNTIDLCGTGGDGKNTFNISTLASFVAAGAGQYVTKHGNNSMSSVCGSSNVLAHLGYEFTNDVDQLHFQLENSGLAFLHAPLFHPAMKNVAKIRKELGLKTFFNMLGPIVNPAQPKNQLVGVYSLELARLYDYLFQKGHQNYCIVHSLDGYDEVSLTGDFKCNTRQGAEVLSPAQIGLKRLDPNDLKGGTTIRESAQIFLNILNREGTLSQNSVVIINAALALKTAQKISMSDAIQMAEESLYSGRAFKCFQKLLRKPSLKHVV